MRLITQRGLIRQVVEKWEQRYPPKTANLKQMKILENLHKLNTEMATIDDVAKIIGNYSWTRIKCDECGRDDDELDTVVQVGQEPNYDSATALLCNKCAEQALNLFTHNMPTKYKKATLSYKKGENKA